MLKKKKEEIKHRKFEEASYAKKYYEALAKSNQTQRIVATWLLFASRKVKSR